MIKVLDISNTSSEELTDYFAHQTLIQGVKKLPDGPDPEDKVSLHKAKKLIQCFAYEGLALPEKLVNYQDVILSGRPPKSIRDAHKHDENKRRAMDVIMLREFCGMNRIEACEKIIKRDSLHVEPESLNELISRNYKVSRREALEHKRKFYEFLDPITSEELKRRILSKS